MQAGKGAAGRKKFLVGPFNRSSQQEPWPAACGPVGTRSTLAWSWLAEPRQGPASTCHIRLFMDLGKENPRFTVPQNPVVRNDDTWAARELKKPGLLQDLGTN
jgi:hypothetical protein